jgi:hypothetical protein
MEPAEVPLSRAAIHLSAVPLELSVILGHSYKVEKKLRKKENLQNVL